MSNVIFEEDIERLIFEKSEYVLDTEKLVMGDTLILHWQSISGTITGTQGESELIISDSIGLTPYCYLRLGDATNGQILFFTGWNSTGLSGNERRLFLSEPLSENHSGADVFIGTIERFTDLKGNTFEQLTAANQAYWCGYSWMATQSPSINNIDSNTFIKVKRKGIFEGTKNRRLTEDDVYEVLTSVFAMTGVAAVANTFYTQINTSQFLNGAKKITYGFNFNRFFLNSTQSDFNIRLTDGFNLFGLGGEGNTTAQWNRSLNINNETTGTPVFFGGRIFNENRKSFIFKIDLENNQIRRSGFRGNNEPFGDFISSNPIIQSPPLKYAQIPNNLIESVNFGRNFVNGTNGAHKVWNFFFLSTYDFTNRELQLILEYIWNLQQETV